MRFDVGFQNLDNGLLDSVRVIFQRIDWNHDEVETDEGVETIATQFMNQRV